jgi:hypothetical protein
MPKFDIPVIVQVDTDDIDNARQSVYALLEELAGDHPVAPVNHDKVKLAIANDEYKTKDGRRLVILHPENAHAEYSPDEYAANRDKEDDQ